jgi:hypothetical protein
MPVIAINIDQRLYQAALEAVTSGNYNDLQQFFLVAAENQLTLEASIRSGAPNHASPDPDAPPTPESSVPATVRTIRIAEAGLPQPRRLADLNTVLWGQVNRLLPIAAGVRVLAHLSTEREAVPVSIWHDAATDAALVLRTHLRILDQAAGRRHGNLWATAFPDDTPASAQRYVSQFLGFPKTGLSDGGAAFLGFVDFDSEEGAARLTTSGAEWAAFQNPVFDDSATSEHTFTPVETTFYLSHLERYRPGELLLLRRIARQVEKGLSRVQLDEALIADYPGWTKYVETMRAGALGRLSDLGLLERTRRGTTVDYALTNLATEVGLLQLNQEVVA